MGGAVIGLREGEVYIDVLFIHRSYVRAYLRAIGVRFEEHKRFMWSVFIAYGTEEQLDKAARVFG